jgi:glutamate-1-semialdehyde 2,1-aminomutase
MHHVAKAITESYLSRTAKSQARIEQARLFMPGGDTRWSTFYSPYPTFMERGEGCYLYDSDGNRYIDFLNNYTALIHGHCHPAVVEAASLQVQQGPVFGAPVQCQYELAEILCNRIPGLDLVRFCNSGTEATMMAMRAARAFTGKDVIVKMDGGYHGTHEFVEVNVRPDTNLEGLPTPHLEGAGVPNCVLEGTMLARFNDLEIVEWGLKLHANKIAAVIVEPMPNAAGMVPPQPGYLKDLRQLTQEYGVLLIFDEIVTLRLSTGGMQLLEDVTPDLTALGKLIGGGFAIGGFGGKREIMERFDPTHPQNIKHSGTFNGHNVAMAAGAATLREYDQTAIDNINQLGEHLQSRFDEAFKDAGLHGHTTGIGSLLYVHWTDKEIKNPTDVVLWKEQAGELPRLLHLELLNRGIFSANRGMFSISTPMTEQEIDETVAAFGATLKTLTPYVADVAPHLLVD